MNFSFRGAFNRNNFSKSSYYFTKSFFKFNVKNQFNILNANINTNSKIKIDLSNASFVNKMQTLSQCKTVLSSISQNDIVCGKEVLSKEDCVLGSNIKSTQMLTDDIILLGETCLFKEECKWTCCHPLASHPLDLVIRTINNTI